MGLQLSSGKSRGARGDLNITPLVDVALVLLVIFMVATPLTMRSLPLEIPAQAETGAVPAQRSIIVAVGPAGALELTVGGSREQVEPAALAPRLRALSDARLEPTVFVDFDAELPYGRAVGVADTIRSAGVDRIHLVTEPR